MSVNVLGQHFEAVIFDCDGVLVLSEHAWRNAEEKLCAEYGSTRPTDVSTSGETMRGTVSKVLPYLSDENELRIAEDRYVEIAKTCVPELLVPIRGSTSFLRHCSKRVPVCVASNSHRQVLDGVLRGLGILSNLSFSIAGNEVDFGKPSPLIYEVAAKALKVRPDSTLVIEDSALGVRAALDAGMSVIQLLTSPELLPQSGTMAALSDYQSLRRVTTFG